MNIHTIGLVSETMGAALEDEDYVLFRGSFRMIAVLERTDEFVKVSFRYLRDEGSWDMVLTPTDKVYKLSPTRLTGMKGE